jgi:hypothetical protein
MSATGQKWPLYFMAKVKANRFEASQIGDVGGYWKAHSPSRWMATDTFADDLCKFREHGGTDQKTILICDLRASHRAAAVS